MRNTLLLVPLLATAGSASARGSETEPVRLLVVTGGGTYESSIFSMFNQLEGIKWTHSTSDVDAFKEDIRESFDVVLFYNIGRNLPEPQKSNLVDFVNSGKGVVVLHHAFWTTNS